MSDVKPTPGPWTTENATGRLPLDIICDYQIPGAGYPVLIATVFSDEDEDANFQKNAESIDNRQAMANARLIAAAPCMLAMLDRCIVELRATVDGTDGLFDAELLKDAIALYRKIIKPEWPMAIVFVTLRGSEHQVEYRTVAVETDTVHTPPETVEWEFAEPTKFTPDLTAEEVAVIEQAVAVAVDTPN